MIGSPQLKNSVVGRLVAAVVALSLAPVSAGPLRLAETGSPLMYPLLTAWATAYRGVAPDVVIDPQSSGFGPAIQQVQISRVAFGATDAPVGDELMKKAPLLNVPLAIGAQVVIYNLRELGGAALALDGAVLAGIYSGAIPFWDDAKIAALNPALAAKLPHKAIVPIHRTDGSEDTLLFTAYLSAADAAWSAKPGSAAEIVWPKFKKSVPAVYNRGVVQMTKDVPYAIGYAAISYLRLAAGFKLGVAALGNASGAFVAPSAESLRAAAAGLSAIPADARVTLLGATAAGAYPIANVEYAVVRLQQKRPGVVAPLKKFLTWALSPAGGSAANFVDPYGFVALPPALADKSKAQVALIH